MSFDLKATQVPGTIENIGLPVTCIRCKAIFTRTPLEAGGSQYVVGICRKCRTIEFRKMRV